MARHQFVGSLGVLMLGIALGEHVFFLRLQHGKPPDFGEISIKTVFAAGNGRQCCLGHISTLLKIIGSLKASRYARPETRRDYPCDR